MAESSAAGSTGIVLSAEVCGLKERTISVPDRHIEHFRNVKGLYDSIVDFGLLWYWSEHDTHAFFYIFTSDFWQILNSRGVDKWEQPDGRVALHFIPIIQNSHWYLAVYEDAHPHSPQAHLYFYDSLGRQHARSAGAEKICAYFEKTCKPASIVAHDVDIPRQRNTEDCGIFLLALVEDITTKYRWSDNYFSLHKDINPFGLLKNTDDVIKQKRASLLQDLDDFRTWAMSMKASRQ